MENGIGILAKNLRENFLKYHFSIKNFVAETIIFKNSHYGDKKWFGIFKIFKQINPSPHLIICFYHVCIKIMFLIDKIFLNNNIKNS